MRRTLPPSLDIPWYLGPLDWRTLFQLVQAKVISRATGLRMLVDSGVDVDDISEELDAIASTDFEGASALLDATGSDDAVFDYLGRSAPETDDAPTLDLPPPA